MAQVQLLSAVWSLCRCKVRRNKCVSCFYCRCLYTCRCTSRNDGMSVIVRPTPEQTAKPNIVTTCLLFLSLSSCHLCATCTDYRWVRVALMKNEQLTHQYSASSIPTNSSPPSDPCKSSACTPLQRAAHAAVVPAPQHDTYLSNQRSPRPITHPIPL